MDLLKTPPSCKKKIPSVICLSNIDTSFITANAGELWTELRQESRIKLLKEDSTIAPELKVKLTWMLKEKNALLIISLK